MGCIQSHETWHVFTILDQICVNTVNDCCCLSAVTVYFSPKMQYQALENYLHIPNNSIAFISLNGELLYKCVCFPTVSLFCNLPEVKHVKMHRNKRNWQDKPVLILFLEADSFKRLFCVVLLLDVFLPSQLKQMQTCYPLYSTVVSPYLQRAEVPTAQMRLCWNKVRSSLYGMIELD